MTKPVKPIGKCARCVRRVWRKKDWRMKRTCRATSWRVWAIMWRAKGVKLWAGMNWQIPRFPMVPLSLAGWDTGRLHWRQPDRDIVLWWLRHVCCTSFVIKVRNGLNRSLISAIIHWKIYMTTNRWNEAGRRKCVHCWWVYRDLCGLSSATSPKRWNILSSPVWQQWPKEHGLFRCTRTGTDSWRLWIILPGILM